MKILKNIFLFAIAISGLIIGLYALSLYPPQEDLLKERPAPSLDQVFEYKQKINGIGENCGRIKGNCQICLECVDNYGNRLITKDFQENTKTGTCKYIEKGKNDDVSCQSPLRRCDGKGNCVRCFEDSHCGECSKCVVDFFNIPGKIDIGECVPKETQNKNTCNANQYRDGFTGIGTCYHGNCAECLEDNDCPKELRCEENLCAK
jgi:hypothetical protein